MHEVLLHERNKPQQVARERVRPANANERAEHIVIDLGQHLPHHDRFLKAVDEHSVRVGRVVAQHAPAEAVEGGDPRFAVVILQAFVDSPADLVGGAG